MADLFHRMVLFLKQKGILNYNEFITLQNKFYALMGLRL
jgi:hypothetical protein